MTRESLANKLTRAMTDGMDRYSGDPPTAARVGDTSGIESGFELRRGKLYDRELTGRAPLEVFSIVLLIISSRSRLWKRRFEQRSGRRHDDT